MLIKLKIEINFIKTYFSIFVMQIKWYAW